MHTSEQSHPSIDDYFQHQHAQLEQILSDIEFLTDRHSFVTAAKRFGEFQRGLEEHLELEEQVLLPLIQERTGDPAGLVPSIRSDHESLRKHLMEMGAAISCWDRGLLARHMAALSATLTAHHATENQLMHPALDAILKSETDWWSLINRARHPSGAR